MPLEGAGVFVDTLVPSWPVDITDLLGEGDDHLRRIKEALQATFGNAGRKYWLGGWAERQSNVRIVTGTYSPVVSNTTDTDNGRLLVANTNDAAVTILLPAVEIAKTGYVLLIQKVGLTAREVTIVPNASESIDGLNVSISLLSPNHCISIVCDGSGWRTQGYAHTRRHSITVAGATHLITALHHGCQLNYLHAACVITLPLISTVGEGFEVHLLGPGGSGYYQVNRNGPDEFAGGVVSFRNYGGLAPGGHHLAQRIWVQNGEWRRTPTIYVATFGISPPPYAVSESHFLGTTPFRIGFHILFIAASGSYGEGEIAQPMSASSASASANAGSLILRVRDHVQYHNTTSDTPVDVSNAVNRLVVWGEI